MVMNEWIRRGHATVGVLVLGVVVTSCFSGDSDSRSERRESRVSISSGFDAPGSQEPSERIDEQADASRLGLVVRGVDELGLPAKVAPLAFGLDKGPVHEYQPTSRSSEPGVSHFAWQGDSVARTIVIDRGYLHRIRVLPGMPSTLHLDPVVAPHEEQAGSLPPVAELRTFQLGGGDDCSAFVEAVEPEDYSLWNAAAGREVVGVPVEIVGEVAGLDSEEPCFVALYQDGERLLTATVDSMGKFRFPKIGQGDYVVVAAQGRLRTGSTRLTVAGVDVKARVQLDSSEVLAGKVVDHDGQPVVGARILCERAGGELSTRERTDDQGAFALPLEGYRAVWVCVPGNGLQWPLVRANLGAGLHETIRLPKDDGKGRVRLKVSCPPDVPPEFVSARLWHERSSVGMRIKAHADRLTFEAASVPRGNYLLEVYCLGYGQVSASRVWCDGSGVKEVTESIPEPGELVLEGMQVDLDQVEVERIRPDGRWRIALPKRAGAAIRLGPGNYQIHTGDRCGARVRKSIAVVAGQRHFLEW